MSEKTKPGILSRRSFTAGGAAIALATGYGWRIADAAGAGNLNSKVVGTQEPTLIFVHGFACALDDWNAQVDGLSSRFRCAALDLPGHGASAKPETASIAALAIAVNVIKEQTGTRAAILVGHSMGCRVITEAFLQSRSGVAGLVYVDGSILGGDPATAIERAKAAIDRGGMDALTQRLFNDMFLEGSDAKLRERLVSRAQGVDAKFREELFVDLVRWDVTKGKDALKQITIPALVLQSTYINSELKRLPMQEGMTTPWIDAIKASVPKSEIKVISGAGHFTMIEAAPAVTAEMQAFASRLARGA